MKLFSETPAFAPFDLGNKTAYARWRELKLADYPSCKEDLLVVIEDLHGLSPEENEAFVWACRKANFVIYACQRKSADKGGLRALGAQLGLHRLDNNLCADEDAITALRVVPGGRHSGYIPYTNRPLNWHTDGYYNAPDQKIQAWSLHCVQAAASGGENALLDPEIAYLLMRDENPDYIAAFMHPEAMTLPANASEGAEIRAEQTGPVFSVNPASGTLHMRYTVRKRHIIWRDDPSTRAAVQFMEALFERGSPYIFKHRLAPGQGIVSNNALHNRSGFCDASDAGKQRLIYRVRYYDRIAGTDSCDIYA